MAINGNLMANEPDLEVSEAKKPVFNADFLYFQWILDVIKGNYYEKLLECLFSVKFNPDPESLDNNRAMDGLRLRERFFEENKGKIPMKKGPCTFLEMLVALSIRLDNDILYESRFGDRHLDWFWMFIDNMELTDATNEHWNPHWDRFVKQKCRKIKGKSYKSDGNGGMFVVKEHPEADLRDCDIWRQMIWWVDENIKRGVIE